MRRVAKFVAGMLVALTAMPVLAVAPCQQAIHSMKCCRTECPMTTKAPGAKVTSTTSPEITKSVCCSPSSQRAIPFTEQRATENRTDVAMLHSQATNVVIAVAERHELKSPHERPPVFGPSRTSLCTFLI